MPVCVTCSHTHTQNTAPILSGTEFSREWLGNSFDGYTRGVARHRTTHFQNKRTFSTYAPQYLETFFSPGKIVLPTLCIDLFTRHAGFLESPLLERIDCVFTCCRREIFRNCRASLGVKRPFKGLLKSDHRIQDATTDVCFAERQTLRLFTLGWTQRKHESQSSVLWNTERITVIE